MGFYDVLCTLEKQRKKRETWEKLAAASDVQLELFTYNQCIGGTRTA